MKLFKFISVFILIIFLSTSLVAGVTYLHNFPVQGAGNSFTGAVSLNYDEFNFCYGGPMDCYYDLWCQKNGYYNHYYNNYAPPYGGYIAFTAGGAGYVESLYGEVGCSNYVTCDDTTYFPEQGKCCAVSGTMATAGDPYNRCCYYGVTYPSDSLTVDALYVCYEAQLYGKKDPVAVNTIRIDDGCALREAGSKYYFNQLNLDEPWKFDGDTTEVECGMCGTNTWNIDISNNQCCGDDGQDDTGRIVLENTGACYKGEWMDTRNDIDQAFKIFSADDVNNNELFEYDIISTGDYWHTCDANGLVPDTKSGVQLAAGGYLLQPSPREYVIETSTPFIEDEAQTSTSLDWDLYTQSGVSPVITETTEAGTPVTTVVETGTIDNSDIAARFICAKEDMDSRFLECCPDPDVCVNRENNRYRLPGAFLNTIEEFTTSIGNPGPYGWGLKTNFFEETYTLQVFLNHKDPSGSFVADSKLNDWSSFDYFEFFVYAVDDLNLDLYIGGEKLPDTNGYLGSHYTALFNQPILTSPYAVNGAGLKKWIKVRVPISEVLDNTKINVIELRANKQISTDLGTDFSIGGENYHNLLFIDKMHLVDEDNDFICSGGDYDENNRPHLWVQDLDQDQTSCQSIPGFAWSGSQCCGDDVNEYYKDGENYCWNGNLLEKGSAVADFDPYSEDTDILYSESGLLSCSSSRTSVTHGDFTELVNPVGDISSTCNIVGDHVCSPNGKWSRELYGLSTIDERNVIKSTPDNSEQVCCAQEQCWTSKKCIDAGSGIQETTSPELLAGGSWGDPVLQACVLDSLGSGEWQDVYMSEKWDGSSTAYCPEQTTCWDGLKCVFEETFSNDFYCKQGSWSTRTKLLAGKLLQIAKRDSDDDYNIYCDSPENALPYTTYPELDLFLQQGGANNFCVLKMGDKVVAGTSLNSGMLGQFASIVDLSCNDVDGSGDIYELCVDGDNKLWYNTKYNSIIYAKDGVFVEELDANQLFNLWIKSPLDTTIELLSSVIRPITRTLTGTLLGEEFIQNARDFNRLYVGKLNNKEVLGIIEQVDPEHSYLSVDYNKFKTDVCRLVDKAKVFCQPVIGPTTDTYADYRLFSFSPDLDSLDEIWQSATSKLRLESKTFTSFGAPSAEIESPLSGDIFYHTDNVQLKVVNAQEDVTYYWDLDSSETLNGEVKGSSYIGQASTLFKSPGAKIITLIALDKHGRFNTAQVDVVKN